MSISSARKQKRGRGRPRVDAVPVNTRFPPDELERLDKWIEQSNPELTRPEAVRRLVEIAIGKSKHAKR